jgi:hypothetical protein
MKSLLRLYLLIMLPTQVFAQEPKPAPTMPSGLVEKMRGTVLFNGSAIKEGDIINKVGKIETKEKSFLKIKIEKWKNVISIGPSSVMELNFNDEKKYTLDEGQCRWKSFAPSDSKGKIFTKFVSMGVRGTDFIVKANPALSESEIVVLDGEVMMDNLADKANSELIKKGQWGGIGGRFGSKIQPPINLPESVLKEMDKSIE